MSFKNLGHMLVMALCVMAIYFIDLSALLPFALGISVIGTVGVLGYAFYRTKTWKKTLLALGIAVVLCVAPTIVQAQNTEGGTTHTSQIDTVADFISKGEPLCDVELEEPITAKSEFDMEMFKLAKEISQAGSRLYTQIEDNEQAMDILVCAKTYQIYVAAIRNAKIDQCPNMTQYMQRYVEDCWICGIGHLIITAAENLVSYVEEFMRQTALQLLAIMFLFWIAIRVVLLFGTWGYANIAEFFSDIMMRLFAVIFAAALLFVPLKEVFSLTVSPLMSLATGFGIEISNSVLSQGNGNTFAERVNQELGIDTSAACPYCTQLEASSSASTSSGTGAASQEMFSQTAVNSMLCLTCKTYNQLTPFIALGQRFVCSSFEQVSLLEKGLSVVTGLPPIPDMKMLFTGLALVIVFVVLLFLSSFPVIDSFFRLGMILLFMPIFIATWAFPISRAYTKNAFNIVLYSLLELVGMAIAIGLIMNLFLSFVPMSDKLIEAIGEDKVKDMLNLLIGESSLYVILVLIGLGMVGMQIISSVGQVVTALSGLSAPSSAGSAAGNSMVNTGVKTGAAAVSIAAAGLSEVGEMVMDAVKDEYENSSLKKGVDKFKNEVKNARQEAGDMVQKKGDIMGSDIEKAGNAAGKATEKGAKAAGKATEQGAKAAGQAVDKGGQAAGAAVEAGGQAAGAGMQAGGNAMISAGSALSGTVVGSIVGVPLAIAGGITVGAGVATKAASKAAGAAVKAGAKVAGKAIEKGGKAASYAMRKGGKVASKGIKKGSQMTANQVRKTVNSASDSIRGEQGGNGENNAAKAQQKMAQQQNNTKQQTQAANSKAEQMAQAVEKDLKNTPAPQQNAAMEPKGEPQNNTVEPQQELQNNVVEPQGEKEEENALNSAVNAVAAQGTLTPYPEDNGVVNDSASAEEMGTPPAENNGSDNNQVSNEPNPADKSDRNDSEEGERSDSKEQKKG